MMSQGGVLYVSGVVEISPSETWAVDMEAGVKGTARPR